ncbi:MAG: hypothetical protein R2880_15410 [Deinococcales bacterium]
MSYSIPSEVICEALSRFETPFYLYSESVFRKRALALDQAFARADFKNYFAVKATPNPFISA